MTNVSTIAAHQQTFAAYALLEQVVSNNGPHFTAADWGPTHSVCPVSSLLQWSSGNICPGLQKCNEGWKE